MKRPSLLTLMLVPTLLSITVGLVGFGVYVDRTESANRLADIDDELVRAEAARDSRNAPVVASDQPGAPATEPDDPSIVPAESPGILTVDPPSEITLATDGTVLRVTGGDNPFTSDELLVLAERDGTVTSAAGDFRVRISPLPEGATSLTSLPLDRFNAAVDDFRRTLLVGGLVVVVLEAIVLWLVARMVSRPVVRMAGTATRVADGELDTAIGAPSGTRETAQLAADLERMLVRIRSTLEVSESSATDARTARDQMERFLADVSHEFRTPLTALHGYSDLYMNGMLDDAGLERAMQRMGNESARLNSLVNDMMQLARNASTDTEPEVFDVAEIVTDVVDDLRSAYPDRRIERRMPPGIDCRIAGVPGRLHQAILNLGANACGHSDGDVQIRMTADRTHLDVSVVDHGPGIAEADRERIFQPFVRLDASRTRTGHAGAGLGLALTNQIIASHQGAITVGETPGGGTTITVRLPCVPQAIEEPVEAP
ncbi:sensor histidine kinase [Ilumatobacter sp.]|uniref:sensor histidine kinase n=1 Tax=Ilumatobacter sp. TaxID=1967498 RepID=UPI003C5FA143